MGHRLWFSTPPIHLGVGGSVPEQLGRRAPTGDVRSCPANREAFQGLRGKGTGSHEPGSFPLLMGAVLQRWLIHNHTIHHIWR